MPQAAPRLQKPNASDLFTDRNDQRELLGRVLAPVATHDLGSEFTITVFYGVGGVGKTRLCEHGLELAGKNFSDRVVCAYANFDAQGWHPETSFSLVAAELCRALHRVGVVPRLATVLLALQQVAPVGGGDERWGLVLDGLDKGVEMSGIPGLSLLVKAGMAVRDRVQQARLRQRLQDLGLWPLETAGQINVTDLQEKLALALHHDVVDFLLANPERHLRLFIDGFERMQSHANRHDTQWHLQAFVGYFATSTESVAGRFRTLLFGREKLLWDELYQDSTWPRYWNQHLLGGLAQADALDFLRKCQTWHRSRGQSTLADALARYEAAMLDASDEQVQGQQVYYPFFLNLAIDLLERAAASGTVPDLGRAPIELQERFLRYLDQKEKRALQILALAETFDEKLFDWLAGERLIGYERSTFHSQLRQERSYFQAVEGRPGEWKLHRKMEDALHALWHSTPSEQHEGRAIVLRLLDYYAAPLTKPERDWGDAEVESWRRGMEIIITQGPEGRLFGKGDWEAISKRNPWFIHHFRCLEQRLEFTRRILTQNERLLGCEHPDTLTSYNTLGFLLFTQGEYLRAEPMLRKALDGREKALGLDHPDTLTSYNDLGFLLYTQGDYLRAESLLRHALHGREKALGPEYQDTLMSLNCLGNILSANGDHAGAELLYRRTLAGREKSLGPEHPDTLASVENLAILLARSGKHSAAEELLMRCLSDNEKTMGLDHPTTLWCASNCGENQRLQMKLAKAEVLCRRALLGAEKVLGDHHPRTLDYALGLALVLVDKNDCAAAHKIVNRSLDGSPNKLCLEDDSTRGMVLKLASFCRSQGDTQSAKELLSKYAAQTPRCLAGVRYTLASVESLSGNLAEARRLLVDEIAARPAVRDQALKDEDLNSMHGWILSL